MTATLSAPPRRTDGSITTPARELPVLFHLMDVGRTKRQPPTANFLQPEPPPAAIEPELAAAAIEPTPIEPTQPVSAEPKLAEVSAEQPPAISTETASPSALLAEAVVVPVAHESAPASNVTAVVESTPLQPSEPTPPPTAPAAPRSLHEKRQAKTRAPAREEWFTAHGKYIAIGFMLALVGTIYLARTNRGGSTPVADAQPHVHPGEAGDHQTHSESKAVTVVGEAKDAATSKAPSSGAVEVSPARLADAPYVDQASQADLHPPTTPQLVREPSGPNPPGQDGLFPWAQGTDDRFASRPQPNVAEVQGPQYPLTEPNAALSRSYSAPAPRNGNSFVPPEQQPNIGANYPGAPQPPLNGAALAPPAGGPAPQYTPHDNTARGYRYERTGSGTY